MTSRLNILISTTLSREGDARTQPALPSEAPDSLDPTSTSSSRPSTPPEPSMSTAFPLVVSPDIPLVVGPDTPLVAGTDDPLIADSSISQIADPATPPPDAVLISRDNVHFFVKGICLFPAFRNLLPARGPLVSSLPSARGPLVAGLPSVLSPSVSGLPSVRGSRVAGLPSARAPDSAETLNIILHAALNREMLSFAPSVSAIGAAVDKFNAYGLDASVLLAPGRPLHKFLTAQIPSAPLAVYVVAARADARALAAAASAHLLGEPVHTISDKRAEAMGAVYLKRLFMLHRRRLDALRELLGRAPGVHEGEGEGGKSCEGGVPRVHEGADGDGGRCEDWSVLARRWDNVTAEIVVNAKPDTPGSEIEEKLSSIARHLSCEFCKTSLYERIQECVADWSAVGKTI
ncbi:hypothetical protein EV715DRAFT_296124 [Schizophyllum commune]